MEEIKEQVSKQKKTAKLTNFGYLLLLSAIVGISVYLFVTQSTNGWYYFMIFLLVVLHCNVVPEPDDDNFKRIMLNLYVFGYGWFLLYHWYNHDTVLYKIHGWMGLYFGIIAPILTWVTYNENVSKVEKLKFLAGNNFDIDRTIVLDTTKEILVESKKQKLIFWDNQTCFQDMNYRIFDFKDIYDFDLIEDGFSKLQGRGMVSAVGALTFGITGAIIGTVAGDRKSKNYCNSIYVNVSVNDLNCPLISVVFLNTEVEKSSYEYKQALKKAQEFIALLTFVKNQAHIETEKVLLEKTDEK